MCCTLILTKKKDMAGYEILFGMLMILMAVAGEHLDVLP